ncbi:MAG TPA: hypothetical protein VM124_02020 [Candidatus Limnocylindrales bacterium]|nr:hypothetical protein [Candidatus Limnocylindrales bacterium]
MSGYKATNLAPGEMDQEDRLGHLSYAFEHLEELNPQGADTRYTAGAKVWAQAMGAPAVRDLCGQILDARSQIRQEPFLNIAEVWMRASNEAVQPFRNDIGWPHMFDGEKPWEALIREIVDERGDLVGSFFVRAASGTVQANVPSRAIFPAMVANLYKHRLGPDIRVADVGASMNHTLNALMMPSNILKGVQVVRGNRTRLAQLQLHHLVKGIEITRPTFGASTGYEVENMLNGRTKAWDPEARSWVRINTIRPDEEVYDPELVEEYDKVDNFSSENIGFVRADFTKDPAIFEPKLGDEGHDIVNVSAMTYQYQSEPDTLATILENCRAVGKRGAIIALLDFGRPDQNNPQKVSYFKKRLSYTFRGLVYDLLMPELGFQELVRFKTGRCKEVQPGRDWSRFASEARLLAS